MGWGPTRLGYLIRKQTRGCQKEPLVEIQQYQNSENFSKIILNIFEKGGWYWISDDDLTYPIDNSELPN